MLTSTKNPRIQRIRKLQSSNRTRRKENCFVVEGVRLVEEAINSGWLPEVLFYTENINPRGAEIVERIREQDAEIALVAPHVMQAASDTQTPQGVLAAFPINNILAFCHCSKKRISRPLITCFGLEKVISICSNPYNEFVKNKIPIVF